MGALLIAAAIVVLIVYDVVAGRGFSAWWAGHAITTSLVSDLLIVGATALIFDEVQSYRQRKDRSLSVASPSLFDDPDARDFLLKLDRLMAALFATASGHGDRSDGMGQTVGLTNRMNDVDSSFEPLVARFPPGYQKRVRRVDDDIAADDSGAATDDDSGRGR